MKEVKIPQTFITLAVGIAIWLIPAPDGVKIEAWHLFAIFVSTILGIILKAAPKFELIATNSISDGIMNASIAVSDGELFLRTEKHLWCIR